jgi:hypothetical protein
MESTIEIIFRTTHLTFAAMLELFSYVFLVILTILLGITGCRARRE